MIRVILKVKDKSQTKSLEKWGSIVYVSLVLNVVSLEVRKELLEELRNDNNVISCEIEPEGNLNVC